MTYGYDDRGQLTGADYTGASQPADAVYNYDGNGNRSDANFVVGDHNLPQSDGTYSYAYDAEGNRIGRTNLSTGEYDVYQWDNRNRLTAVIHYAADHSQLWTVAYQYDFANHLIARSQMVSGQNAVTQLFVYDGNQIVLTTDAAGNVTHRYLWGESVDQILADESVDLVTGTSQTRWTLTDHLNTVRSSVKVRLNPTSSSAATKRPYGAQRVSRKSLIAVRSPRGRLEGRWCGKSSPH